MISFLLTRQSRTWAQKRPEDSINIYNADRKRLLRAQHSIAQVGSKSHALNGIRWNLQVLPTGIYYTFGLLSAFITGPLTR